jgi:bifunctional non-homologous end joining protein LigD
VRNVLSSYRLPSFAKTTGGKGLHLVVPIQPEFEWDVVKGFCREVANSLQAQYPNIFVAKSSKARRRGRVFIDYLRNGRGATAIASYSLRARPGMPCAMPISWEDLDAVGPGRYQYHEALEKLEADEVWPDLKNQAVSLKSLLEG